MRVFRAARAQLAECPVWMPDGNSIVFTSDRAICSSCARKADCAATGHQWDVWRDGGDVAGVPYRTRWCDHCGDTEYDPPFGALVLFRRLAEDASAD